ncbi:interleukin-6 receptor subunit beta [Myripristis murdjan]|uniref:interleukin-6 receptor subunit beta n=1 Tax=Myripristis murdjan TaxID=586833 RepID=UPI001175DF74|nr:interleukin-6 receptor subunit beta-like [Myripristis murdjan]
MGSRMFDLATLGVICLFFTSSYELTVTSSALKSCKNNPQLCVTKLEDCEPRPASSRLEDLNVSCFYQPARYLSLSGFMSCSWSREPEPGSHDDSSSSLIFITQAPVVSCDGIFTLASILNVTVRIKNYMEEREIWSEPQRVDLYLAVKAFQPVLTVVKSTAASALVSWQSSGDGSCRLRHRLSTTDIWTEDPEFVPVHGRQTRLFTIKDLLPFSVYRAAVACRGETGFWSDWSSDVTLRTLERAPSGAPEVCYRLEKTTSGGSSLLHLMWKALDLLEAGGRVLGYQLSYAPTKKKQQLLQQQSTILNTTELTALLVVKERYYSVNITAFNTAGLGPATQLSVDTHTQHTLPSVRHLWVSSLFPIKALLVQWEPPPGTDLPDDQLAPPTAPLSALPPAPPVSQFAIRWISKSDPSSSHWSRADGFTSSAVIQGHLEPDQSYNISVFPVSGELCGPPQALPASLQHGALLEAVRLQQVGVTKTTVTVMWAWQRRTEPIRVSRYRVMLRSDSEEQVLSVWPDQSEHTFLNLTPNTEYSVLLLADDASRELIPIKTDFDEFTAVATATPLLLLAFIVLVLSILSRTVYKSYFFPEISSPHGSTTGQWLMELHHQKTAESSILDIENFRVTDVLGKKHLKVVAPDSRLSSDEDLHEHTPPPSLSHLIIELSALKMSLSDPVTAGTTEQKLLSLPSCGPDYVVNLPERAPEETKEETVFLLPRHTGDCCFPAREDKSGPVGISLTENVVSCCFHENGESCCVSQMPCETEYVLNSYFVENPAGEPSSENHHAADRAAEEDSKNTLNLLCSL